jgi:hypothetical protein
MAGLIVVAASPSGPIGLLKESAAAGRMVMEELKSHSSELMRALSADLGQSMHAIRMDTKDPNEVRRLSLEACRSAAAIVAQKGSAEEAAQFRAWLNALARKVAEAAKEGGFLGFGGTLVSEQEEAALRDLAAALG